MKYLGMVLVLSLSACAALGKEATLQNDTNVQMIVQDNKMLLGVAGDKVSPSTKDSIDVNASAAARQARKMAREAGNSDLPEIK